MRGPRAYTAGPLLPFPPALCGGPRSLGPGKGRTRDVGGIRLLNLVFENDQLPSDSPGESPVWYARPPQTTCSGVWECFLAWRATPDSSDWKSLRILHGSKAGTSNCIGEICGLGVAGLRTAPEPRGLEPDTPFVAARLGELPALLWAARRRAAPPGTCGEKGAREKRSVPLLKPWRPGCRRRACRGARDASL